MAKIRHVSLTYNLWFRSVEDIITSGETARRVRDAEAAVKQYPMGGGIFVHVGYYNNPKGSTLAFPRHIDVRIEKGVSEAPEDLEEAIAKFIAIAGPPSFVTKDSDLGLIKRALEPLGLGLVKPPIYSIDRWVGYMRIAKRA